MPHLDRVPFACQLEWPAITDPLHCHNLNVCLITCDAPDRYLCLALIPDGTEQVDRHRVLTRS